MTERIKIPVVGGSYKHDSLPFDAQETINLFVERGGKGSKSRAIFRRLPGLASYVSTGFGSGVMRGMYVTSNDRFFAVRADYLLEISTAPVASEKGRIETYDGNISMTDNGTQLGVSDGTNIWCYTLATDTLAKVTDADAPDNTPVLEFIDGYIFGFDPTASLGSFKHSDLNDLTVWNSIDVYTAEGSPDKLVTMKAHNKQLWLFGSKSFEVWYNNGGDNVSSQTWLRLPGTFKNIGCGAIFSVSSIRSAIFWLGASKDGDSIVWMCQGSYEPIQISTKAMETTISGFSTISDATSYTFEYLGHYFYVLTFPTGKKTFVYDLTENEWVNWDYRNASTGDKERHRSVNHVFFDRKSLVGDYENGKIYELSKTTYTDDGNPIVWERYFQHFENQKERITWFMLQLDILVGSALRSGQGSDPKIQLRWSDDGGYTYSNWRELTLGVTGDYSRRVITRLLGESRDRIYHIRSSEPIDISIQDGAIAEIEGSAF